MESGNPFDRAVAACEDGEYQTAIEAAQLVLRSIDEQETPDSTRLGDALELLATCAWHGDDKELADRAFTRLLRHTEGTHGERSLEAGLVCEQYGSALLDFGDPRAQATLLYAAELLETRIRSLRRTLGETYHSLSVMADKASDLDAAHDLARRAVEEIDVPGPASHSGLIYPLGHLASLLRRKGDDEKAQSIEVRADAYLAEFQDRYAQRLECTGAEHDWRL